ncbi:MAG: alpha/beta hydrolase [Hyphomonadaceae bacterium]|nr:alpha/beta hydrolase [Hyphomonadaceae bacterium]
MIRTLATAGLCLVVAACQTHGVGPRMDPQTATWVADFATQPPRESQGLEDLRQTYREALIAGSVPPDPRVATRALSYPSAAGPQAARLYTPAGAAARGPLILYVHGGGFAVGDLDSHDSLARLISASARVRVLTLDYRRAPEAPFPAARDDVVSAFEWVAAHAGDLGADARHIALAGESAGAAHAVAAAQILKTRTARPKLVWVMSPALDATTSGRSYQTYATGAGRTAAEFAYLWSLYVPDAAKRRTPEVSPVFADLTGFPSLFIYPAQLDPAHDDGIAFAQRAERHGTPVTLRVRAGLIHQYPEITGVSRASRTAVVQAAREVTAALRR